MPDDKAPKDRTYPPPPMDPFPTYQTPFPRSNKDDEQNPFIQFRRFADEQVSSLLSGFPQFFGLASGASDHWKREVEDIMRQRQEWEEGFRKQFEQEMEEMRQQLEKSKTEAWKGMEDAWKQHSKQYEKKDEGAPTPWWARGKAVQCPALNGQQPQSNAAKCPALYDEKGQPRTELDAYNALQADSDKQVQVFQASAPESPKKPLKSWFSALGWDGQQKEKSSNSDAASGEDAMVKSEKPLGRPTTYSLWAARRMQPFDNADETIPWLMLSPYSPIYLCNPAQSRLFKVKVQDSEGAPLQISSARFFERWYTDVDEKMATQKPWADAFEDLLSVQQTGKMVDRDNWNTWRTPSTWIHDMVNRGSLGNRWGFNDQGLLVKRADATKVTLETAPESKEDRCAKWRKNRDCRGKKSSEPTPAPASSPAGDESALVDKVTEALAPFPLFGSIISAADAIVSAVDQASQKETQTHAQAVSSTDASASERQSHAATQEQSQNTSSAHSASSTSYLYDSSVPSPAKSIVSTLTTTTTRTLPDGSVETKRVLKRRFTDGSEESDERVEVKNASSAIGTNTNADFRGTWPITNAKQTKDKETQTQVQPGMLEDAPLHPQRLEEQHHQAAQQREEHPAHQRQLDDDQLALQRQPQRQYPRRIAIINDDEDGNVSTPEAQQPQTPETQHQQQAAAATRRRGSGWFWN
ncbi:hypothetical protein A1O7_04774 [Cladophialophora yegresii CBS 114405]|uniref:Uncharacterized protein n=1 Tax=Cladophialophora yegresii CBS 114405 TaxID=1182544 RepID=W9W7W2_9EURO|nr:uncharacterized protein A1O7_04774 [Cladophialophora yegresii CBS 114405]EXJ60621.1 hypothetical protein A1O7_04774 [Cladophialophora yegresii CBS 114405]